jgi:hypothetical protein
VTRCETKHKFLRRDIGQATGVVTVDGAQCELKHGHKGPHRNGCLIWHDPPLLVVGGRA